MARTCTKHLRYRSFCRCRIRYRTSDIRYRTFSIRYRIQYIRYRMRYRTYDIVYDMHVRYCNCNLQRHASFIYRIRYRIRHRMRYPFIISDLYSRMLLPGPAPQPSAAPSDAGDNLPWNSDDERDFQDQQYSPPSPMSHYPGSLNPIKSGFPTGILVGIFFHAGHIVPGCPLSVPLGALGRFRSVD